MGFFEHFADIDVVFQIGGLLAKCVADFEKNVVDVFVRLVSERVQILA